MRRKEKLHLEISQELTEECVDDEVVAYLTLPDHPGRGEAGIVDKSVRLRDLIGDYSGPDLLFDFDARNVLIGIEILD